MREHVNIAEIKVATAPAILVCTGMGSCVGVALYDATLKVGGLAHVMLPDSRLVKGEINPGKFADTAIYFMLQDMLKVGANKNKIKAKIFGGANMFSSLVTNALLMVGDRNIEAVYAELRQHAIPLIAKDVGGNSGRTISFDVSTGKVIVKISKTNKEIIF